MAGERLPARLSALNQVRHWRTGKCFETATNHILTIGRHTKKATAQASTFGFCRHKIQP